MTPSDAYKAILQHFGTEWSALNPAVPYTIDNRRLTQPTPPFAQVEITNLGSDQRTMGKAGNRRFERRGFIDVRLYAARDVGRGQLDSLAETVTEIFEALDLSGLRTYATSVTELRSNREYPALWCLLVRTPFEFDETR